MSSGSKSKSNSSSTQTTQNQTENYTNQETSPVSLADIDNENGRLVVGREININNEFSDNVANAYNNLISEASKTIQESLQVASNISDSAITASQIVSSENAKRIAQVNETNSNNLRQALTVVAETSDKNSENLLDLAALKTAPNAASTVKIVSALAFPIVAFAIIYFLKK